MKPVAIILALGLIAAGAESARASSPDAWTELFKRASAACAWASVAAVMFNLGYLPGEDHALATEADETLRALDAACVVMKSGAVLSVVCYPGHPQGGEEAACVERWMNKRAADAWRVAKYAMVGTKAPAPFLMIARKP